MSRSEISRRRFAKLATMAAGALVSAAIGVPIVGFVLSPLYGPRAGLAWRKVGDVSGLPPGRPTRYVVSFPEGDWSDRSEEHAVYVVREGDQVIPLGNTCTHMQCAVRWQEDIGQFLCPCHGGLYTVTGRNVGGPPPKPLPRYVHRIQDGVLFVANAFTESI
jgi:menaquinol-cytochrome c reductase iron-sulfur subunit